MINVIIFYLELCAIFFTNLYILEHFYISIILNLYAYIVRLLKVFLFMFVYFFFECYGEYTSGEEVNNLCEDPWHDTTSKKKKTITSKSMIS